MLTDDQVVSMMNWQRHAALWVTSQAIALRNMTEREGLDDMSDNTAMTLALELFRLAREEEAGR